MIKIILAVLLFTSVAHGKLTTSFYHQSVYLEKYTDLINQGQFKVLKSHEHYDLYLGLNYDFDNKSDKTVTYTDQQINPLIGMQSKVYWYSKLFSEYRGVYRQGEFFDDRTKTTNDLRVGVLGYNKINYDKAFQEFYYVIFYSSLYNDQVILQGWHKHGLMLNGFDLFNELYVDSFDITKSRQFTTDLRPGVRFSKRFSQSSIQLLFQRLIPIDQSGRSNESRATLVYYIEQ